MNDELGKVRHPEGCFVFKGSFAEVRAALCIAKQCYGSLDLAGKVEVWAFRECQIGVANPVDSEARISKKSETS